MPQHFGNIMDARADSCIAGKSMPEIMNPKILDIRFIERTDERFASARCDLWLTVYGRGFLEKNRINVYGKAPG
jgi:hypothetical protein